VTWATHLVAVMVCLAAPLASAQTAVQQARATQVLPTPDSTLSAEGVVALRLNGAAPAQAQALCDVWGLRSTVPVEVLKGSRREAALKALNVPAAEFDDSSKPWLALRCQTMLPDGAQVSLRWMRPQPPGAQDERVGVESWDGQRFDFRARSDWPLAINCTRVNAGVGCNPLLPVALQFLAPVRAADLLQVRLKSPSGKLLAPREGAELARQEWAQQVEFAGLAPNASYDIVWPERLQTRQDQDLLASARQKTALKVQMGPYPPLLKFGANFGIAELAAGGVVPLTVRAVEGAPNPQAKLRSLLVRDEASIIEAYGELMRVTRNDDALALRGDEGEGEGEALEDEAAARSALAAASAASAPAAIKNKPRFAFKVAIEKDSGLPTDARAQSWLRTLTAAQMPVKTQALPRKLEGQAFEVLGIPLTEPGFYLLEAESKQLGRSLVAAGRTMYVRAGALVTDLAVHLHHSDRLAQVWVTRLSTGQPVADARVSLLDCRGKALGPAATGSTNAQGWLSVEIIRSDENWRCPMFAFARLGNDMGLVSSAWQRGIETWRFDALQTLRTDSGDRVVHVVLARNLLRPGEMLHARLYWRHINVRGELTAPPRDSLPKTVDIVHTGSGERRAVPANWDARGNADLSWKLADGAKRGAYVIALGGTSREHSFRVEDFRLPLLKAEVVAPAAAQVLAAVSADKPGAVDVSLRLSYLSGGAAAGESVQVFQRLAPLNPRFTAYSDFWFGVDNRYRYENEGDEGEFATEADSEVVGDDKARKLDANGSLVVSAKFKKPFTGARTLITEMEYRDPNGETYRAQGRTPIWPAAIVLGIKADTWGIGGGGKEREVEFVALNPQGAPVAGVAVQVEGGLEGYVSYRRKTALGYYGYASEKREFEPQPLCKGTTDKRGRLLCKFGVPTRNFDSGQFRVLATAQDSQGRVATAGTSLWVYDDGEVWFAQSDNDRMDVLADKPRYKPGEVAMLQVRSPFREAMAWVNVMRSGAVVDTLVLPLTGSKPTLRVPIKTSYAPNVFFNVLAVRGRVAAPAPTALVDLARPAYKLGIVPIEVGADEQLLKVQVQTDKAVYQSREKAKVSIRVNSTAGALPVEREVTVFAIDEALLELWPNNSWDLFKAMLAQRGYGFESASASMQVIGKRHFGRKALPPGGGGGKSAARELFDTLLLWRGTVNLDEQGRATVEVPINDSLTRFRVVVVANAGVDRFGSGEASFVATKDLQVLPGLPATAREGDRFVAGFTLRNTTALAMQTTVNAQLNDKALPPQMLSLAPGQAQGVSWPVDVPTEAAELRWRVEAKANTPEGARDDTVLLRQPVGTSMQALRYSITTQTPQAGAGAVAALIQPPAGTVVGKGEIRVSLSPALATDATGVRDYMKSYPFYCLEQRTSKAVSLKDKVLWQIISNNIDRYITTTGLVDYYPEQGSGGGYDVLTSFVLSALHEAGWRLPEDAERRMLDGLEQFVRGRIERRFDYYRDDGHGLTERKLLALEALARYRTVDPLLADSLKLDASTDLPKLSHRAIVQWLDVLHRVSWPNKDKALRAALAELDKRLVDDGRGGQRFNARSDENRWYLMYSEPVSQVRLALLAVDMPELKNRAEQTARAAINMQRGGAAWWETQANVWGSLMLDKRAARAVGGISGVTSIAISADGAPTVTQVHDWAKLPQGESYVFAASVLGASHSGAVAFLHQGTGKPVAVAAGTAWGELKAAQQSDAELTRMVKPIRQQVPGQITAGDVVEVKVRFQVKADAGWVVVSDPIPTGSTLLGSGLGGQSQITTGEGRRGWRGDDGSWEAWPAYVERTFTHVRAYYEYLWRGPMTLTYQLRINNAGSFRMPPTQLEAMYDPTVFAYRPNGTLEVK
jgi:alpha-2-macroglobulin